MSHYLNRVTRGELFIWAVILIGFWAAFMAGNLIAEGNYLTVCLAVAAVFIILGVIVIRDYWWLPIFFISVVGMSTTATGFRMEGTDLMGLIAFLCLIVMMGMHQLKPKNTESALGVFFFLLLLYAGLHALLYGVDNYFNGDTQFKNIVKRYYAIVVPLILVWCMDRYARAKSLKWAILTIIILTTFFSIVAIFIKLFNYSIPGISGGTLSFSWAAYMEVEGYLRWAILPILLLTLCMIPFKNGNESRENLIYLGCFVILFVASFFGGGRVVLIMILVFVGVWLAVRKKWKQFLMGGWILAMGCLALLFLGHTVDTKKLQVMPESLHNVQRAISIFLPADEVNDEEVMTEGSNRWHEDLVMKSWERTNEDCRSFILGHGFKGWDDSIDALKFAYGEAYYDAVNMAVNLGQSETMLFSILPIFGWVGVLLIYAFTITLMVRTLKIRKYCPEGSMARCLCEYSFCLMFVTLVVSPIGGAIPSYNMIFWLLGFIAAEPYIERAPQSFIRLPSLIQKLTHELG